MSNIEAGKVYIRLAADDQQMKSGLAKAQQHLTSFTSSVSQTVAGMAGGLFLGKNLVSPLMGGIVDYDRQIRMAAATSQAVGKDFELLQRKARETGRDTSLTATQAASALTSLSRSGFSPQESAAALDGVVNLSLATGTDLAKSADIAANSMRIFNIRATEMGDVSDILTATANGSAQTLEDLFEALKYVGPQASAAGASLLETASAIGVLANMGIKGSMAGTALARSYTQFTDPQIQQRLREIGVETVDSTGDLRKMSDIIREIGYAMAKMPSGKRLAFARDIFQVRGQIAGLSLGASTEKLDAFAKKLENVGGVAERTRRQVAGGTAGNWDSMVSTFESLTLTVGEELAPAINNALKGFSDLFKFLGSVFGLSKDGIMLFRGLGSSLAFLTASVVAHTVALKAAAAARAMFNAVSAHPVQIISTVALAAVTAMVAEAHNLQQAFDDARTETVRLQNELANIASEDVVGRIGKLRELIRALDRESEAAQMNNVYNSKVIKRAYDERIEALQRELQLLLKVKKEKDELSSPLQALKDRGVITAEDRETQKEQVKWFKQAAEERLKGIRREIEEDAQAGLDTSAPWKDEIERLEQDIRLLDAAKKKLEETEEKKGPEGVSEQDVRNARSKIDEARQKMNDELMNEENRKLAVIRRQNEELERQCQLVSRFKRQEAEEKQKRADDAQSRMDEIVAKLQDEAAKATDEYTRKKIAQKIGIEMWTRRSQINRLRGEAEKAAAEAEEYDDKLAAVKAEGSARLDREKKAIRSSRVGFVAEQLEDVDYFGDRKKREKELRGMFEGKGRKAAFREAEEMANDTTLDEVRSARRVFKLMRGEEDFKTEDDRRKAISAEVENIRRYREERQSIVESYGKHLQALEDAERASREENRRNLASPSTGTFNSAAAALFSAIQKTPQDKIEENTGKTNELLDRLNRKIDVIEMERRFAREELEQ